MKYFSLSFCLVLKSSLSNINMVTPPFFWLCSCGMYFFHPFAVSLSKSFYLKVVVCFLKTESAESYFYLTQSHNFCRFEFFRPFPTNVIIDEVEFKPTVLFFYIYPLALYFCFYRINFLFPFYFRYYVFVITLVFVYIIYQNLSSNNSIPFQV